MNDADSPRIDISRTRTAGDVVAQAASLSVDGDFTTTIGNVSDSVLNIIQAGISNLDASDFASSPRQFRADVFQSARVPVPRPGLFSSINDFIGTRTTGVIVIEGPAGTGKSMLLAHLAHWPGVVVHACEPGDRHRGALDLLGQITLLSDPHGTIPVSATISFDACVSTLRHRLWDIHGRRIFILLDSALDPQEVASHNFYGLPDPLPAQVFLIVASRPGLAYTRTDDLLVLNTTEEHYWRDDLKRFITEYMSTEDIPDQSTVDAVVESTGGSWLLARFLLDHAEQASNIEDAESSQPVAMSLARHIAKELRQSRSIYPRSHEALALGCVTGGSVPLDALVLHDRDRDRIYEDVVSSTNSTALLVMQLDASAALRHSLIRETVLQPPEGLLAADNQELTLVVQRGRSLANEIVETLDKGDTQLTLLVASESSAAFLGACRFVADTFMGFCTMLYGQGHSVVSGGHELRVLLDSSAAGSWHSYVSQLNARLSTLYSLHFGSDDLSSASLIAVGNLIQSAAARLPTIGGPALAALWRRHAIDTSELDHLLADFDSSLALEAICECLAPDSHLRDLPGSGWAHIVAPLAAAKHLEPDSDPVLFDLAVGHYVDAQRHFRVRFAEVLTRVNSPDTFPWQVLADSETDPYIRVLLAAGALRAGVTAPWPVDTANDSLAYLRGIEQIQALIVLLQFSENDDWTDAAAQVLAEARLGFYGPLAPRILLEVARGASKDLQRALADEVIACICRPSNDVSPMWRVHLSSVLAATMPGASAAGVHAALSYVSEAKDPDNALTLAGIVARSEDLASVSVAYNYVRRSQSDRRAEVVMLLGARVQELGGDLDEDEILQAFTGAAGRPTPRMVMQAAHFPALRAQLMELGPEDFPTAFERIGYVRALAGWLTPDAIDTWIDSTPELYDFEVLHLRDSLLAEAPLPLATKILSSLRENSDRHAVLKSALLIVISSDASRGSRERLDLLIEEVEIDDIREVLLAASTIADWAIPAVVGKLLGEPDDKLRLKGLADLSAISGVPLASSIRAEGSSSLLRLMKAVRPARTDTRFFSEFFSEEVSNKVGESGSESSVLLRQAICLERMQGRLPLSTFESVLEALVSELDDDRGPAEAGLLLGELVELLELKVAPGSGDVVVPALSALKNADLIPIANGIAAALGCGSGEDLWSLSVESLQDEDVAYLMEVLSDSAKLDGSGLTLNLWKKLFAEVLERGIGAQSMFRLALSMPIESDREFALGVVLDALTAFSPAEIRFVAGQMWQRHTGMMIRAVETLAETFGAESVIADMVEGCHAGGATAAETVWRVSRRFTDVTRARTLTEAAPAFPLERHEFWLDYLASVTSLGRTECYALIARALHHGAGSEHLRMHVVDLIRVALDGMP